MNTNNKINPTLESCLRERFSIFIVNNFGVGFFNMETKICNRCNKEKLIDEFNFRTDSNKYHNECKLCQKKYSKK